MKRIVMSVVVVFTTSCAICDESAEFARALTKNERKPQMKSTIVMLFLAFPLILNAVGPSAEELALAKVRNSGAEAKEYLRVVDQDGMPVFGAKIDGGL